MPVRSLARLAVCAAATLCAGGPGQSAAQDDGNKAPHYDSRTDRLRSLSHADLTRLQPYVSRGPVALIEFADTKHDQLPGINVAVEVQASAREVVAILEKPEHYPRFMKTLDEVALVHRAGRQVVYDWSWGMGLVELSGRNAMTFYDAPSPEALRKRGYRITVDSQSGDLGTGRMLLKVLPRGARKCLVVMSMRLDLRKANYIARRLSAAARSINRSANMSLTYSMLLSLRREAERRSGFVRKGQRGDARAKPKVDVRAIMPLLPRGDVVLLDMDGEDLNQIAVYGVIGHKRRLVREIMLDADAFGSALMPGSEAVVVARKGPETVFDWDIDLPLVGVSGQMKLRDEDPVVAIQATRGALAGGHWSFETTSLGKHATMVAGWASFDVRKSSWLLKSLADSDPYLGHGMSAASEVMLVRALRSRARKRAKKR